MSQGGIHSLCSSCSNLREGTWWEVGTWRSETYMANTIFQDERVRLSPLEVCFGRADVPIVVGRVVHEGQRASRVNSLPLTEPE